MDDTSSEGSSLGVFQQCHVFGTEQSGVPLPFFQGEGNMPHLIGKSAHERSDGAPGGRCHVWVFLRVDVMTHGDHVVVEVVHLHEHTFLVLCTHDGGSITLLVTVHIASDAHQMRVVAIHVEVEHLILPHHNFKL